MVNNYVRTRFFAFKQKKLGSSEEARTLLEGAQPFGKEKRITANISNCKTTPNDALIIF